MGAGVGVGVGVDMGRSGAWAGVGAWVLTERHTIICVSGFSDVVHYPPNPGSRV